MPPPPQQDDDPGIDVTRGWQRSASRALDDFGDRALRRELNPASATMLDSQSGPYAARVLTARPTPPELCLPSPLFQALLLRRLRMPLPLAPGACRCQRGLDAFGDHVAACPRSGVLRSRGRPMAGLLRGQQPASAAKLEPQSSRTSCFGT